MASQVFMGSLNSLMLMSNSTSPSPYDKDALLSANATVTGNATTLASSRPFFFLPLPEIIFSLIIKNQDFLKLMLMGGFLETCRRCASSLWEWILSQFCFTVHFESTDETYEWMMAWLIQKGTWTTSREIHITSMTWGKGDKGMDLERQDSAVDEDDALKKRKLSYLPAHHSQHWVKHRGIWISVVRKTMENNDRWIGMTKEKLTVKIYCRDQRFVRTLLEDAKRSFGLDDSELVNVHSFSRSVAEWRHAFSRLKRPISSIILEPEIKQKILDDCRDFLQNQEWYTDRGIPYRRGYLLHGVPGSGKTSLIHSIAGELDLDIYVVSLSKKGLDDTDLLELISQLPGRCIALIEDIDVAFKGEKRSNVAVISNEESEDEEKKQTSGFGGNENSTGVTLSGLLNALDGLIAQEGRLLFATTNCMEAIDEALCRPGRMDVHVEFKNASRSQARQLFRCFFPPTPSQSDKVANSNGPHFRSVPLTAHEATSLAEKFSDTIPEGVFSVATLQGFLLNYKDKPYVAVELAPEWVKGEMEKRSAKLKAEAEETERKKGKVEAERASEESNKKDANGKKRRGRRR